MAKIKMITAYDQGYAPVGDIAARSMTVYAAVNGLTFQKHDMPAIDRPPAWGKIRLLLEEMDRQDGHDFLFWVDADACFLRTDRQIADHIQDGKDFYLVSHLYEKYDLAPGVRLAVERPNTGVFLLRKSDWSRAFLEKIWSMTQYTNHQWWEQGAVLDLIGYRCETYRDIKYNTAEADVLDKLVWLPQEWNSIPNLGREERCGTEVLDPVILHFAGLNVEQRKPLMEALTMKVKLSP